jgi:hypothetical protein
VAYARKVIKPLQAEHGVLATRIGSSKIEIRFEGRAIPQQGGFMGGEEGPEAVFSIERDGQVYGFQRPARLHGYAVKEQEFVCLGSPATITNEAFGQAVCDFLEWGAAGDGKSRFSTPL